MDQIWKQFRILLWKNFLLKSRRWSTFLLEIFIPAIILIGIWGLSLVATTKTIPESIPSLPQDYVPSFEVSSKLFKSVSI
jgi:hypothetical protein